MGLVSTSPVTKARNLHSKNVAGLYESEKVKEGRENNEKGRTFRYVLLHRKVSSFNSARVETEMATAASRFFEQSFQRLDLCLSFSRLILPNKVTSASLFLPSSRDTPLTGGTPNELYVHAYRTSCIFSSLNRTMILWSMTTNYSWAHSWNSCFFINHHLYLCDFSFHEYLIRTCKIFGKSNSSQIFNFANGILWIALLFGLFDFHILGIVRFSCGSHW